MTPDKWNFVMRNHNVEIDHIHSRAICDEIGERLRIFLADELPEMSPQMQRQVDQLREPDEAVLPSNVSSRLRTNSDLPPPKKNKSHH
jgi:hypothetical protein